MARRGRKSVMMRPSLAQCGYLVTIVHPADDVHRDRSIGDTGRMRSTSRPASSYGPTCGGEEIRAVGDHVGVRCRTGGAVGDHPAHKAPHWGHCAPWIPSGDSQRVLISTAAESKLHEH
jgi:hypothetical protein